MRPSFPAVPFAAAALAAAVSSVAPTASAQQLRYTGTAPGNVVATGNTLGLSKELNANGPGIRDSIGTFLTLGATIDNVPANPANPWPMGTTYDWTQNGSAAVLTLPSEASVLYAELLWGGSYQYGDEDVTAALGSLVTLESDNATLAVAPDPATALTENSIAASGFAVRYYMRSANVTPFVKSHGAGTYTVKGVPATQTSQINSLNAAGWTLVVAYRDETAPTRNLSVFVGGSFVDEDSQQDYTVSGFCAPPAGAVTGTAIVSAVEGDANLTGDQLLIAPTAAGPFVQLSGPNNPANNFFCSQLNDKNGNLDTQGTFGDKNQDAVAGANIAGGRQGWDVTTVPLSSQAGQLVNGQTTAILRTITTGDSYMPILASFAIDVNAPKVAGQNNQLTAMPDTVMLGDTYTLTATLKNTGQLAAQELLFKLPPPAGVSLVSFKSDGVSGDINGQAVSAATLTNGVPEGTLSSGQSRVVSVVFKVDADPQSALLYHFVTWGYGFQACVGAPLLHESVSRSVTVSFSAGGSGGAGGATGGAGGAMGGAGGAMGGSNTGGATGGSGTGGATGGSAQGGAGGSGGATGGSTGGSNTGGASGGSAAGGAGATGGGTGGDAGQAGEGGRVIETGGCSCRTTDEKPSPSGALLSVVALAALLSRPRRRDRRSASPTL